MITQVNGKNEAKYRELFDKASKILVKYPIEGTGPSTNEEDIEVTPDNEYKDYYINDLYDYFIAFPNILKAAGKKDQDDNAKVPGDNQYWTKYFTILPLDEPVFEVDANTRKITVPNQFKIVGVEGDKSAEIIFFLIDRFFDTMDFGAQEIQAVIEWQRSSGKNPTKQADPAYIKELTLHSNKVLIGWIIKEEIAEEAGSIDFALRLFKETKTGDNKEIEYSFSTEPAKITIAKTLNVYPEQDEDLDTDPIAQVLSRIASTTSPSNLWGDNTLIPPTFETNIKDLKDSDDNPLTFKYINDDEYYADLNSDTDTLLLNIKAKSNNATNRITYKWSSWDKDTSTWSTFTAESSEGAGGNEVELEQVGKYKCTAIDTSSGYRTVTKDSEILYILEPEAPVVKAFEPDTKYYSAYIENNSASLNVKPGLEENKFISGAYDAKNATSIGFSWSKSTALEGERELIDDATLQEYLATEEGYYFGSSKTTRNNSTKESAEATIYRVTNNLELPGPDSYIIKDTISQPSSLVGSLKETIEIDLSNYPHDLIEYQWYVTKDILDADLSYKLVETKGNHGCAEGGIISFTPETVGYYKVNIIAHRNGQKVPAGAGEITTEGEGYELIKSNGKSHYITINNHS